MRNSIVVILLVGIVAASVASTFAFCLMQAIGGSRPLLLRAAA